MTKAAPVEYVKICSEFGEGFYYIPGTDTCLAINGYVRADYWWFEPDSRADDGLRFNGRGRVNFDARTATEWGTLRSFISIEYNHNAATNNVVRADKAFIQFGGWTAGYATSFYDFYDAEAGNTLYGTYFSSSKTTHLLAYTATFGDGFAATLSVEDNYYRRSGYGDLYIAEGGADPYAEYAGQRFPDVVASLRWTQDWGLAQIMAAAHQTRTSLTDLFVGNPLLSGNDKWGWAVGGGVILNLPSGFFFGFEINYARGAVSYAGFSLDDPDTFDAGGLQYDGDMTLSHAMSVTADLGYNFTPFLAGHIVASYADYDAPSGVHIDLNTFRPVQHGPDFETWAVTANLTYTIVKGMTITGEVSYEERTRHSYVSNFDIYEVDDYDTWAAGMRLKRSF